LGLALDMMAGTATTLVEADYPGQLYPEVERGQETPQPDYPSGAEHRGRDPGRRAFTSIESRPFTIAWNVSPYTVSTLFAMKYQPAC
jgi:hypothetical protein